MAKSDKYNERKCWIDTFDQDHFLGTMHRIFGPVTVTDFHAGSIVVGPEAHLKLTIRRAGPESVLSFEGNSLLPDLTAELKGAQVVKASIEPVMKVTVATAPRRQPRSQSGRRRQ